jgi:hypothetical protein
MIIYVLALCQEFRPLDFFEKILYNNNREMQEHNKDGGKVMEEPTSTKYPDIEKVDVVVTYKDGTTDVTELSFEKDTKNYVKFSISIKHGCQFCWNKWDVGMTFDMGGWFYDCDDEVMCPRCGKVGRALE